MRHYRLISINTCSVVNCKVLHLQWRHHNVLMECIALSWRRLIFWDMMLQNGASTIFHYRIQLNIQSNWCMCKRLHPLRQHSILHFNELSEPIWISRKPIAIYLSGLGMTVLILWFKPISSDVMDNIPYCVTLGQFCRWFNMMSEA